MNFNIKKVPFSFRGSYYAFLHTESWEDEAEGIYIKSVYKDTYRTKICKIELLRSGEAVEFEEIEEPHCLTLKSSYGSAEFVFGDSNTIQFAANGVDLRFIFQRASQLTASRDKYMINACNQGEKVITSAIKGKMVRRQEWDGDNATYGHIDFLTQQGDLEGCLEIFRGTSTIAGKDIKSFQLVKERNKNIFNKWTKTGLKVPEKYSDTSVLANYINWSCVVEPKGFLTRDTMLASKNWMCSIWGWDHCFNAMAIVRQDPKLAWDQMMVIFDKQDEFGCLPDSLNHCSYQYCFNKPPIHGWALNWMMERTDFIDDEKLKEIYDPLCRWTEWWFKYRDNDGNGIPEYHNGNDSGWDNSTVFYEGVPMEAPDLCTYLILQIETLSKIAYKLNKKDDSDSWKFKSQELLKKMLEVLWDGDGFRARLSEENKLVKSKSLLLYVPLLLEERLPKYIRDILVRKLKDEKTFYTAYGLASESLNSDLYEEDGYWRGPVWAPPTLIFSEALRNIGEIEFSREIAEKYCNMVNKSGMSENFSSLTGKPLRDPTITWTSCIFTILASEYI